MWKLPHRKCSLTHSHFKCIVKYQRHLYPFYTLPLSTRLHGTIIFFGSEFFFHRSSIHITVDSTLSLIYTSTEESGGLENSEKLVLLNVMTPICPGSRISLSCNAFTSPGATASLDAKIASGYSSGVWLSRYSSTFWQLLLEFISQSMTRLSSNRF